MRTILGELLDMLTYCRPMESPAEHAYIDRYIAVLPGIARDPIGNWIVTIGESPILWSSHTDTVHNRSDRQTVHYDPASGIVALSQRSKRRSNCLGADCTAGNWIMRQMILRKVPGTYVFHTGEEMGGIGSQWLADNRADWLKSFTFAVAFDRRGTTSVITEQRWCRTASDAFAHSLADELRRVSALTYTPDDRGIYTDTAEYAHVIAECSNVSVGYSAEHTPRETLDVKHCLQLLDAMCQIDQSRLISERIPASPVDTFEYFDAIDYRYSGRRTLSLWECPWHDAGLDCSCIGIDHGRVDDPFDDLDSIGTEKSRYLDAYLDPVYTDVQSALTSCKADLGLRLLRRKDR